MKHNYEISAWDGRFLSMAKEIARWSKDPSTQVGCVIVRPNKTIASVGYNGFPRGMKDLVSRYNNRDDKYRRVVHAEMNALLNTEGSVEGCTVYLWPFLSCERCTVHLLQSGIKRVVAPQFSEKHAKRWGESLNNALSYFDEANIEVSLDVAVASLELKSMFGVLDQKKILLDKYQTQAVEYEQEIKDLKLLLNKIHVEDLTSFSQATVKELDKVTISLMI